MSMNYINGKNILITWGTGSIWQAVFLRILDTYDPKWITIFSRDEYKQYRLRSLISNHPRKNIVRFIIGDIRDMNSVERIVRNHDSIFHCAALKHVPVSEENPEEFIKTNILWALNLKKAAIDNNIEYVIWISTDKAVNPTNVMWFTKSLQEKVFSSNYLDSESITKFLNVRFGNVINTKWSLFPILAYQIHNNLPLTLTHKDMTRFFMTLDEAVDLVINSALVGASGDTIIRKMHSIKILDLFHSFLQSYHKPHDYPIEYIWVRVWERLNEYLLSYDELLRVKYSENYDYLIIPPYLQSEIDQNIIQLHSWKDESVSLYDFSSENKKYFFTKEEIVLQIESFKIDQEKKLKELI